MKFAVAGVAIAVLWSPGILVAGPSNITCNAWTTTSWSSYLPKDASRPIARTKRATAKPETRLRYAKEDDDGGGDEISKEKNYSPFQASWKTPAAVDDDIEVAAPTPKKTRRNFPKFETPKIRMPDMPDMPDIPRFEAPKMSMKVDMPKIDIPEMKMPKLPKFPERGKKAEPETEPPANYSRLQASWKTTSTETPATKSKLELPAVTMPEMPDLPKFEVPELNVNIEMPKIDVPEMQMPKMQMPKMPKFPERGKKAKPETEPPVNYSRLQASWKTTSTETPATKSKLELPTVSLPDLSSLGLPDAAAAPIKQLDDEARKLSLDIDGRIKEKVNAFTGRTRYEVGDITKAIVAKVANEEFELGEITFFFRILIALGADLSGFSAVLPVSGLVGLLGWSISMGLAERVTQFVVVEINKRVNVDKDGIGDTTEGGTDNAPSAEKYNPGDLTKSALLGYTGKPSYSVGDLASGGAATDSSVLRELEECLSMEKALIEKLDRVQQRKKE